MKKARIALNNAIRENYAFFCPQSNLHLDLMNPVGFTDRVTPSIVRGLKGKTLLDLDNMIDVEGECFIEAGKVEEANIEAPKQKEEAKAEDTKVEVAKVEEAKETEIKEEVKEEVKEEKPATKKKAASKKAKAE